MPAKSLSTKTVSEMCNSLRRNHSEVFGAIRQILKEWHESEDLETCLGQFKELLADKREIADMLNAFLEDEVKFEVAANYTLHELSEEIIKRLRYNNKERLRLFIRFLREYENIITSEQELFKPMLEHFLDIPDIYGLVKNVAAQSRAAEPPPEESPRVVARDEIEFFSGLVDSLPRPQFDFLVKLLYLYENCILSKHDLQVLVPPDFFEKAGEHEFFKGVISSTEVSRRKSSPFFKPLNEIDFSNSLRATHSYVKMPEMYPIKCQGKERNPALKRVLNDKWVSVPVGSEHEAFNVHSKNQFEEALIKSEDERYELDILINRIERICFLCETIIGVAKPDPRHRLRSASGEFICNTESAIEEVMDLSIIQLLYKNLYKEDKSQIEVLLKH
jgi:histone deacetylase complex regulatory component SIN3